MHELQRRQIARITFLFTCVAPTVAVVAFAIWMRFPSYASRYGNRIGQATETVIRIDRITHPKPHVTRLANVRVFELESHDLIFQSSQLDVVRTNLGFEIAGNVELHADAETLWKLIETVLRQNRGPNSTARITIHSDELAWRNDVASQTIHDVKCDIRTSVISDAVSDGATSVDGAGMFLSFRTADRNSADSEPGAIVFQRELVGNRARTSLDARTGEHAIQPSLLFPSWFPYCADSKVCGEIHAIRDSGRWWGTAKAIQWSGLRGKHLVGEQFLPIRLKGDFGLVDGLVEFSDDRIRQATGEIVVQGGVMSGAVVRRLGNIGFRFAKESGDSSSSRTYAIRDSRFSFSVAPEGCTFREVSVPLIASREATAIDDRIQIVPPKTPMRVDQLLSVLVSSGNDRATRIIERLRHRLPLDRLRTADGSR